MCNFINMEKYIEKVKLIYRSFTKTQRIAWTNLGRNNRWKILRKTKITIHKSENRRPMMRIISYRSGRLVIEKHRSCCKPIIILNTERIQRYFLSCMHRKFSFHCVFSVQRESPKLLGAHITRIPCTNRH